MWAWLRVKRDSYQKECDDFTPAALSSFPHTRRLWGTGEEFLRIRKVQAVITVFERGVRESEFSLSLKEKVTIVSDGGAECSSGSYDDITGSHNFEKTN
ncbi:hypothetical protein AVEN_154926-1 [Araneus ventricosus]|uniref:Uncharacterized protein n=1 Tax=Araneus ventricosus TaxID=182803 RepID=A0A4Y2A701_ARAVE|nr:hypothetical protein AVEN_154926-1 [Araneus ventricosus]